MNKKVGIILSLLVGGGVGVLGTLWTTGWPQEQPMTPVSSETKSESKVEELYKKISNLEDAIGTFDQLLTYNSDYDTTPLLRDIYRGEIFAHIKDNVIYVRDEKGEVIKAIKPPEPYEDGHFPFGDAKISPNKRFVLAAIFIGDSGHAWIYDMKSDALHEVTGGLGLGELRWLADNRIVMHSGCVAAEYCKRLESVNSGTPWIVEVAKDLGRYE